MWVFSCLTIVQTSQTMLAWVDVSPLENRMDSTGGHSVGVLLQMAAAVGEIHPFNSLELRQSVDLRGQNRLLCVINHELEASRPGTVF